jgi:hypothetical protein
MLVEFTTKNFRSIRDSMAFSMLATKDKNLAYENLLVNESKLAPRVLRSAAILGGQGSGKSNLLRALEFMRELVVESTANVTLRELHASLAPFRFDIESPLAPTEFSIAVVIANVVYQYAFAVAGGRVIEERLDVGKTAKSQKWFTRAYDKELDRDVYEFGSHLKGKLQQLSQATGPQSLFLAIAAQGGNEMLAPVADWFINKLVVVMKPEAMHDTTFAMLNEPADRKKVCQFLFNSDIRVGDIAVTHKPGRVPKIELVHNVGGREVRFDLAEEGAGTRKIVNLAGLIVDVHKGDKVLVIDSFDASLHPFLVKEYVRLFSTQAAAARGAQLIMVTNRDDVIDASLLRRDQIWFMDRAIDGASKIASLAEFKVRHDADNQKAYREKRFGGVPFLR